MVIQYLLNNTYFLFMILHFPCWILNMTSLKFSVCWHTTICIFILEYCDCFLENKLVFKTSQCHKPEKVMFLVLLIWRKTTWIIIWQMYWNDKWINKSNHIFVDGRRKKTRTIWWTNKFVRYLLIFRWINVYAF